ncbi:hypothetical protein T484DRAFT_2625998 [Baffinella frigidus]|nr:hypothetical protein T484DRAFT_2625998 [Cryptophyta sp. CCMP2293]
MVGPPRPRFASSRKAAPLDLPDGPVDEDVQDALLQELLRRQDAAEKAFSRVLTAFDFAVGCLWLLAAYWHAEKPWPPPFDAFRQRGQGAERVAMMALVLGALSCFLSAFSGVMGNGSSARENRAIHVGATAALAVRN